MDKMYLVIGFKNGSETRIPFRSRLTSIGVSTNSDGSLRKINLNDTSQNLYFVDLKEVNYVYTMEGDND